MPRAANAFTAVLLLGVLAPPLTTAAPSAAGAAGPIDSAGTCPVTVVGYTPSMKEFKGWCSKWCASSTIGLKDPNCTQCPPPLAPLLAAAMVAMAAPHAVADLNCHDLDDDNPHAVEILYPRERTALELGRGLSVIVKAHCRLCARCRLCITSNDTRTEGTNTNKCAAIYPAIAPYLARLAFLIVFEHYLPAFRL